VADAVLAALSAALALSPSLCPQTNTHLCVLSFPAGRSASDAFCRGRLLSAVRANASLRALHAEGADKAEAHVRSRRRATA
jgi:hypothetical protein